MEKKNTIDESDFGENEIPDLNSLKPFEFEPKANIADINSSQKQPSEVFCNKRCAQKFRKILHKLCNFIRNEALAQVFSCEFCEICKNTLFLEHLRTTASEY